MITITKHFQYEDGDFNKTESLIIKPQIYFTMFSARLMSGDVV